MRGVFSEEISGDVGCGGPADLCVDQFVDEKSGACLRRVQGVHLRYIHYLIENRS